MLTQYANIHALRMLICWCLAGKILTTFTHRCRRISTYQTQRWHLFNSMTILRLAQMPKKRSISAALWICAVLFLPLVQPMSSLLALHYDDVRDFILFHPSSWHTRVLLCTSLMLSRHKVPFGVVSQHAESILNDNRLFGVCGWRATPDPITVWCILLTVLQFPPVL